MSTARLLAACLTVVALAAPATSAAAWEFAHGDRDNSGFADVETAPAKKAPITIPGLGKFAPGAGPVVAPDGTVYVGTVQGNLIALRPDGTKLWSRDIGGQSIVASPAVGQDGSIYVVGVRRVRDNRVDPPVEHLSATLHQFNSGGAWSPLKAFPLHDESGPATAAPPMIWRSGGTEAIIAPAFYKHRYGGGHTLRLLAFNINGAILDDKVVTSLTTSVAGGWGRPSWMTIACMVPPFVHCLVAPPGQFDPPPLQSLVPIPPMPGVGIFTFKGGGTPFILVSDHHKDLVGYTFSTQRFTEIFRVHQEDFFVRTPPMILPDGHSLMSTEEIRRDSDGVESAAGYGRTIFAQPNSTRIQPVTNDLVVQAAPTRMADGRVALIEAFGKVVVLQSGQKVASAQAPGRSIASAAASRTHLFVAAEDGFVTYDAKTLAEVARIDWVGGGLNPPAIGPRGHVYAIASNILFVFPPPKQSPLGGATAGGATVGEGESVATNPEPASTPDAKTFKNPMTANGNRLFACEELDQDDCGKGDYRTIATAFCQKQGFIGAGDVDVDSKKVKAESLDGRYCSKKKCKVFEQIVCANN